MLLTSLERLGSEPKDVFQLAADTVQLLSHFPRVAASGYFAAASDGQLRIAGTSWSGFAFERDEFRKGVFAICQKVSRAGVRENFSLADARNMVTWCVPLRSSDEASDVLAVTVTTGPEPMTMIDHQPIEHLIGSLKVWHADRLALRRDAELRGLAAIVELVMMIEQSSTLNEAAHHVVNELQKFLNCQRVALGVTSPLTGGSRLETISGTATFDAFSDTAKYSQAACDETAMRGTIASAPPLNPNAEHSIIALKNLLEHQNSAAAVAVPLMLKRSLIGTLVLTGSREALLEERVLNLLQTAGPILAGALSQTRRIEGSWITRTMRRLMSSRWSTRLAVTGSVAAIVTVLCLPASYRISADATLEPVKRRILSAPYDGILELTYAESGDIVSEGELLARMDAREIRWELSTATAEHSQAVKQFDSELAAENIAKAQLAKMETVRLKRKQELLRHREQNHELKAPMNGMVLNGSVVKLNGAAVRMGQPLFEVAELNPLRLELSVPAEDYFHVRPGKNVSVAFDGFDGETFEGQIVRIRPRSEVRNEKNVFIAELEVPNPDLRLRPGIEGSATIIGDKHSIAWNTFHKAWEALWRTDPTTILTDSRSDASGSSSTTSVATRMEDLPLLPRRTGDRTQVASESDEATQRK